MALNVWFLCVIALSVAGPLSKNHDYEFKVTPSEIIRAKSPLESIKSPKLRSNGIRWSIIYDEVLFKIKCLQEYGQQLIMTKTSNSDFFIIPLLPNSATDSINDISGNIIQYYDNHDVLLTAFIYMIPVIHDLCIYQPNLRAFIQYAQKNIPLYTDFNGLINILMAQTLYYLTKLDSSAFHKIYNNTRLSLQSKSTKPMRSAMVHIQKIYKLIVTGKEWSHIHVTISSDTAKVFICFWRFALRYVVVYQINMISFPPITETHDICTEYIEIVDAIFKNINIVSETAAIKNLLNWKITYSIYNLTSIIHDRITHGNVVDIALPKKCMYWLSKLHTMFNSQSFTT